MVLSLGVVVSIACVGFTNLSMKDRGLGALIMSAHSNSCLYLCAHSTSLLRLTSTSCPHNTQHGSVRTSITISDCEEDAVVAGVVRLHALCVRCAVPECLVCSWKRWN